MEQRRNRIYQPKGGNADRLAERRVSVLLLQPRGSEPLHIHVEHGENVAKFWLELVSLAESRSFRSHELYSVAGAGDRASDDIRGGMECPFPPLSSMPAPWT